MAGFKLIYSCPIPTLNSRRIWLHWIIFCFQTIQLWLGYWNTNIWKFVRLFSNVVFYRLPLRSKPIHFCIILHYFQHLFIFSIHWQTHENVLTRLIDLVWMIIISFCVIFQASSRTTNPISTYIFSTTLSIDRFDHCRRL